MVTRGRKYKNTKIGKACRELDDAIKMLQQAEGLGTLTDGAAETYMKHAMSRMETAFQAVAEVLKINVPESEQPQILDVRVTTALPAADVKTTKTQA